ncbi:hypothetical protein ABZ926_14100 [Streptomyces litmocidini]|uniref:hypothetical protein n=1 Tax=Streptomyces litmocidini TaxID=67318 RepID=UPI00340C5E6D
MVFWDETPPEEARAFQQALDDVLVRLWEIHRRQEADPAYEGPLLQKVALRDLRDAHGRGDAELYLIGLMLDVVMKEAPDRVRDAEGVPDLDRIVRHAYTQEELTGHVVADAERRGVELPAAAELKAYTTRAVATGLRAQSLLQAWVPNPDGTPKGPAYTLQLMALSADQLQFEDVLMYLLTVSRRVRDGGVEGDE